MIAGSSLGSRAAVAVALMVGFYLLALGIAAALAAIPVAEYFGTGRVHARVAFGCLVTAGVILWAVVPRRDHFEPPGPELLPDDQPELFELIERVAEETGQEPPRHVFLVNQVNAFVTDRGGWMGFGSQRVLGLGLPLLQALSVAELRAVLAHEFGHFHGGDVQLGPWIYKTRSAIGRAIQGFADSWMRKPFEWYGTLFLRITLAISRQQEYAADQLAAKVAGAPSMASALARVHGAALAFDPYWEAELAPSLNGGVFPPMAEGFSRYLAAPSIAEQVERAVGSEIEEGKSDPYDSHPALPERLAALGGPEVRLEAAQGQASIELLRDLPGLEKRLVAWLSSDEVANRLDRVAWDEVAQRVFAPEWPELARRFGPFLVGLRAGEVPEVLASLDRDPRHLDALAGRTLELEERRNAASAAIGRGLAAALVGRGAAVHGLPGEAVELACGDERVRPFSLPAQLLEGSVSADEWRSLCARLGIADLDLGASVDASSELPEPQVEEEQEPVPTLHASWVWLWAVPLAVLAAGGYAFFVYFESGKILDQTMPMLLSGMVALVVAGAYCWKWIGLGYMRRHELIGGMDAFRIAILPLIAVLFLTMGILGRLNAVLDDSTASVHELPVTALRDSRSSTFAVMSMEGRSFELRLSREQTERFRSGNASGIRLVTREGAFGYRWTESFELLP
ncbi:MAG: M48 family metallopeptidase [Myxococcota bacterium]|nr:M48 family metallopeptidase [Myxococcota bacterium]